MSPCPVRAATAKPKHTCREQEHIPNPQESQGLGPGGGSGPGGAERPAAAARVRVAVAAESSSACDGVAIGSYKKSPEVKKLIGGARLDLKV